MTETDHQRQARALGDPTRHRIFQLIVNGPTPLTVAELTAEVGFNHNAIRQHLAHLRDAGLVVEERQLRSTPGRPKLVYSVHPAALGTWGAPSPYEHLAELLVEIVRTGASPRDVGRQEGRRQALAKGVATSSTDAMQTITGEASMRGFQPRAEENGEGVDLVLDNCPFAAAAIRDPQTVCDLHLGLAEGMAEVLGHVNVQRLIPRDPAKAGCSLRLACTVTPVELGSARRS